MPLQNTEDFWAQIVRNGLPMFRWFRRAVPLAVADELLCRHPDWPEVRAQILPGDQIWPFRFPRSRRVWGHREGYVVLRGDRFIGGVVTLVS